jgi:hypothetical protein
MLLRGWLEALEQLKLVLSPARDYLGVLEAIGAFLSPLVALAVAVGLGIHQSRLQKAQGALQLKLQRQQIAEQERLQREQITEQERLQRQQLKESRFEKRYAVYQAVLKYTASVGRENGRDEQFQNYYTFRQETDHAEFLFSAKVWDYIKLLDNTGASLRTLYEQIASYNIPLDSRVLSTSFEGPQRQEEAMKKREAARTKRDELLMKIASGLDGEIKRVFYSELLLDDIESDVKPLS